MLDPIIVRLKALIFRARADAELDEELQYHLDREIERSLEKGMSPAQARDAALRAFGNVTVARESARDEARWRPLEEFRQDVAYGMRALRRAPLFALTVIATIGLGVGLLTTAFTVFDAYVLRPLAVRDPAALYDISWRTRNGDWRALSWPQFNRLRAERSIASDAFGYVVHVTRIR